MGTSDDGDGGVFDESVKEPFGECPLFFVIGNDDEMPWLFIKSRWGFLPGFKNEVQLFLGNLSLLKLSNASPAQHGFYNGHFSFHS